MSWLDIIILLPLLIGLVRGLMRGLVIEIISIIAVVAGYVCSRIFGVECATWLMQQFAWPEAVCVVTAYALLFISISIALNLLAKLITKLFTKISLGWLNRIFGGIFGILKWGIIVLVLVLCIHRLDNQFHFFKDELKDQSVIYMQIAPLAEDMWEQVKEQVEEQQAQKTQTIEK